MNTFCDGEMRQFTVMEMEMKMPGRPIAIIYLPVDGGILCFRLRSKLSQPLFPPHAAQSARFRCSFTGYGYAKTQMTRLANPASSM